MRFWIPEPFEPARSDFGKSKNRLKGVDGLPKIALCAPIPYQQKRHFILDWTNDRSCLAIVPFLSV
jgi:hypothetical protein